MTRAARAPVLALAATLLSAVPAAPQGLGLSAVAVRAGFRLDPDQIVLGTHGVLWESSAFRFVGLAELGFGDSFTILTLSPELHYVARSSPLASDVFFYFGGGIDIANAWVEIGNETYGNTDVGLELLSGIESPLGGGVRTLAELRIHIHDFEDWFEIDGGLVFPFGQ